MPVRPHLHWIHQENSGEWLRPALDASAIALLKLQKICETTKFGDCWPNLHTLGGPIFNENIWKKQPLLNILRRNRPNCPDSISRHFEALRGKIVPCALDIWMTVWLWLNFAANLDGVATAHRLSAYMRFKFTRDFQLHHNNRLSRPEKSWLIKESKKW